jgi:diguanylate cyclase (GGDEF)-like protein
MVDIDHFKDVNDTHGHSVGDEVIREVGRRLAGILRAGDILCRYGGEEFAVVLPDTGPADALSTARRLHTAVRRRPVDTAAGPLPVTASVGVSGPADALPDLEAMLKSADDALYVAKRGGRDRVATAEG